MPQTTKSKLTRRVADAAETLLDKRGFVTVFDVLVRMRWFEPVHIEYWQKGISSNVEDDMQSTRPRRLNVITILAEWAADKGLQQSSAAYFGTVRRGDSELQITPENDAELEAAYRRMYLPADATPRQQQRARKKTAKRPDLVVFMVVRDTACEECGAEIHKHDFLFMDNNRPLCLNCADLDHLVYLPSGDATLTRRARKYSKLSAVVVQKSRARRRYERQGVLVDGEALEKAEHECLEDADERAAHRRIAAKRRKIEDMEYQEDVFAELLHRYPGCPRDMARQIAEHTTVRGSGRVGRTAAAKEFDDRALELAVVAAIRHDLTEYDELLMNGVDRESARRQVQSQIRDILNGWRMPSPG